MCSGTGFERPTQNRQGSGLSGRVASYWRFKLVNDNSSMLRHWPLIRTSSQDRFHCVCYYMFSFVICTFSRCYIQKMFRTLVEWYLSPEANPKLEENWPLKTVG